MAKATANSRVGRSVQADPSLVAAANAYNVGNMTKARVRAEKALKANPNEWRAAKIAGMAARRSGDAPAAVRLFERTLRLSDDGETRYELASTLLRLGRHEESLPHYERLLQAQPDHDLAWNEVGSIFLGQRMVADAEACFRRAAAANPGSALYHANLAQTALLAGDPARTISELEQAVALEPANPEWHTQLAKALILDGREPEAVAPLRQALTLDGRHERALALLAAVESHYDAEGALERYRLAHEVSGHPVYLPIMATLLPPVPGTHAEILAARARVDAEVGQLQQRQELRLSLRDLERIPDAQFYFAFHGMNDREILSRISRMYRHLCPDLSWVAPHVAAARPAGRPLRIGFVSMFFFRHSVGIAFRELILKLAQRDGLEVHLIALGRSKANSEEHQALAAGCHKYLALAADSLAEARDRIAALELDALVYPDIGMNAFGKFLAHFRLARVQCVMGGHPDTTGVDTIDYYVSGDLLEPPGADAHYSEKLLRLDRFGTDLWQQSAPKVDFTRAQLHLPDDGRTYLCPMKMQKLHPDLDVALRGILERDPDGRILLVADEKYEPRNARLLARIAQTLPAALLPRVELLPWIPDASRFFATCASVDVVLDSFPFGSGTTAMMLAQAGIPMVTLPGHFARGRGASALYRLLQVEDTVAEDVGDYCNRAVALAGDPGRRRALSERLRHACVAAPVLTGAAEELARTLGEVCGGHDVA